MPTKWQSMRVARPRKLSGPQQEDECAWDVSVIVFDNDISAAASLEAQSCNTTYQRIRLISA